MVFGTITRIPYRRQLCSMASLECLQTMAVGLTEHLLGIAVHFAEDSIFLG